MKKIKYTRKQEKIIAGLTLVGNDALAFYLSALEINKSKIPARTHLLGHCARELDSILRHSFSPIPLIRQDSGHAKSIKDVLGVENSSFGSRWLEMGQEFPRHAHRNLKTTTINEEETASKSFWIEYEDDVLYTLIGGGAFSLSARLEIILKAENPNPEVIKRLPTLLSINATNQYFWLTIDKLSWLTPLFEGGYFSPDKIAVDIHTDDTPRKVISPDWLQYIYLKKVALKNLEVKNHDVESQLVEIIDNIIKYENQNGIIKNHSARLQIAEIIFYLPAPKINERFEFVESSLLYGHWPFGYYIELAVKA